MTYHVLAGLVCAECGRYDTEGKGWRAYQGREHADAAREVFVYCPECAEKEFLDTERGPFSGRRD